MLDQIGTVDATSPARFRLEIPTERRVHRTLATGETSLVSFSPNEVLVEGRDDDRIALAREHGLRLTPPPWST